MAINRLKMDQEYAYSRAKPTLDASVKDLTRPLETLESAVNSVSTNSTGMVRTADLESAVKATGDKIAQDALRKILHYTDTFAPTQWVMHPGDPRSTPTRSAPPELGPELMKTLKQTIQDAKVAAAQLVDRNGDGKLNMDEVANTPGWFTTQTGDAASVGTEVVKDVLGPFLGGLGEWREVIGRAENTSKARQEREACVGDAVEKHIAASAPDAREAMRWFLRHRTLTTTQTTPRGFVGDFDALLGRKRTLLGLGPKPGQYDAGDVSNFLREHDPLFAASSGDLQSYAAAKKQQVEGQELGGMSYDDYVAAKDLPMLAQASDPDRQRVISFLDIGSGPRAG